MIDSYRKDREEKMKAEKSLNAWLDYNNRYIRTYSGILGEKFKGKILDLGCGTDDFSKACRAAGIEAEGIDFDRCNLEADKLPYDDESMNVVTMNAVFEHIRTPDSIMKETNRVLKKGGVVIIRTPNWQMDFKNFFNDPTHCKPYTPKGLSTTLNMYGFKTIFLEPGLICRSKLYWKLPEFLKWKVASMIKGGTKSILAIGEKI